tara:strand:+ start:6436 stop:7533 length:1098 start_codon:yes stop_codon:yes gene_type:complete
MGLFDKIGDVFEDVKDAIVDAAPVLVPVALSYFAPGMSLVSRQALGAGIGTLLKGGKPEDALRSAAIGGALGAVQGGIGGLMQGGQGFGAGMKGAFQSTDGTGIFGRPLRASAAGGDRTFKESLLGRNQFAGQPPANAAEAARNAADATNFLNRAGNPAPSLGDPPSFIASPFNSGPSTEAILNSSNFQTLVNEKGLSPDKALSILKEEYTPSALSRFGLPAFGLASLATFAGDDEEEEDDEYMMTGADKFYANPEDYKIRLYKEGGEVPSKYKGFSKLPEAVQNKIDPSLAAKYKAGGEAYPRRTGGIGPGIGSGTKDDVPALLMDGEFVMTRDAVKGAGNGSIKKGINRMYDVMRDLENKATA